LTLWIIHDIFIDVEHHLNSRRLDDDMENERWKIEHAVQSTGAGVLEGLAS
jgi:hypothetical protein